MKDGFELRDTDGRGEGIFSTRSFKTREIVMVGVIDKVLDGNHSHASQIGKNDYVLHAGSISKVNHSCDPNCGISVNETGAHDFVAIREIIADEEITFDYAMRNYGIGFFPKQCGCGSKGCRGKITGWKDLPDERKKLYEGFVAPYLLELDAKLKSQNANILLTK
ncbi:MAG: SET domain-containing protein-lysine N-methyltransferase [Thermoleophilia bacterium]